MNENPKPSLAEAFRFWLKLGFISFGGPTGQIALMHHELVEKKKWVDEPHFLHALNYCMLLPGPEAQQLATYIGWLLHRTWGGIVAGALFVLPSAVILWVLSYIYVAHGHVAWIASIFYGLKPAVMALVACAVIRIGGKVLKNPAMWIIAALSFIAIYFLRLPYPLIIAGAGLAGFVGGRIKPDTFLIIKGKKTDAIAGDAPPPSWTRTVKILLIGLILWWLPVALVRGHHTLLHEGLFFSKAAVVTFGGAYAVLPYVAQHAVEEHAWLTAGQMMDGLGLAETTPGPLIMVVQFVGFLGGWNHPGNLPPLAAATLGAALSSWVTFLPSFLWIFLGAPYVERLRGNAMLTCTLSAVTAAVVGVVLNLAVWFGLHTLRPAGETIDAFAMVVGLVAFFGMWRLKWDAIPVILACGLLGLAWSLA